MTHNEQNSRLGRLARRREVLARAGAAAAGITAGAMLDAPGAAAAPPGYAVLGTDGTVSGPGGSPLSPSVVTLGSGESPGKLGYQVFPHEADYIANVVGNGIGLVNTATGNTDFSTHSGDHAAVVQQAVNALHANDNGGTIILAGRGGPAQFRSQLVIYPGICLAGRGALASTTSTTGNRPTIESSYNGSAIVVTGDPQSVAYAVIRDLSLFGSNTLGSQNGIEWNEVGGGPIKDTFLERVVVYNVGLDAFLIGGNPAKVWMHQCYAEYNGRHGINQNMVQGNLYLTQCYLLGNGGNGYNGAGGSLMIATCSMFSTNSRVGAALGGSGIVSILDACNITANALQGVVIGNGQSGCSVGNCFFDDNGGPSTPMLECDQFNGGPLSIVGNTFADGRAAGSAVTNYVALQGSGLVRGVIGPNDFNVGSIRGQFIANTSRSNNQFNVRSNRNFNDTGKVSAPFSPAGMIGPWGTSATPATNTAYTAEGVDLYIAASGGSGLSITIIDPAGNAIQSGLPTFAGILPIRHSINFGKFSGHPTFYVGLL